MALIQIRLTIGDKQIVEQRDAETIRFEPILYAAFSAVWDNLERLGLPRPTLEIIPEGNPDFIGTLTESDRIERYDKPKL